MNANISSFDVKPNCFARVVALFHDICFVERVVTILILGISQQAVQGFSDCRSHPACDVAQRMAHARICAS